MALNDRQKRFCENYIANGGNATKAAKDAGYSPKTAGTTGNENMQKPEIKAYIKAFVEKSDRERVATANEVLEYLTSVVRRDQKEHIVVVTKESKSRYDKNGKKVITSKECPQVVAIPSKLVDANKAAELLGKYLQLWDGAGKPKTNNEVLDSLLALMGAKHD